MKRSLFMPVLLAFVLVLTGCQADQTTPESDTAATESASLIVYSGRSESLVEPIIERFEAETGIDVEVRFGGTSELAIALTEEGDQSPADVFWAQDGGALGAVHGAGLLMDLPEAMLSSVPEEYRSSAGTWIATSGRARTLAYSTERADADNLPANIMDLTDPAYNGRIGWAPGNGSFQAFVTGMRNLVGEETTRQWLEGIRDNNPEAYPNNRSIIQGIANGDVDYGLPNHYYLLRYTSEDPNYPVAQAFFAAGDPGNLVNVAGAGILKTSDNADAAQQFINYLLSEDAQAYFTQDVFEYPVIDGLSLAPGLESLETVDAARPTIDLDDLQDLEATLAMLRDVGVL